MPRRAAALLAGLAGLIIGIGLGFAAAQPCAGASCVRLPLVQAAGPSCDASEPLGVGNTETVWMTRYTVTPGEPLAACVYTGGSPASFYAIFRSVEGNAKTGTVAIDERGRATLPIATAALPPGELVTIDVIYVGKPGDGDDAHVGQRLLILVRESTP